MTQSKILVRGEGGLGDCLLANRFIPAIKEKHPNSEITFALDNDTPGTTLSVKTPSLEKA